MALEIIIILSLIQGITEFLPISSSAHLIIIPEFFLNIDSSRGFDVSLHFGSLLAVIYYLKKDLIKIILDTIFLKKDNEGFIILKNLIISTIPVIIVGFLVHINNFDIIRSLEVIGWTTLIFGILLGIADRNLKVIKFFNNLNLKDALAIGIAQTLAIIPGTSRSGIVITAGLWMGFSRFDASKYSLLLSIPVIIAATTLESINLFIEKGFFFNNEMIMGIILSFCVALITIRLFMKWINKASLKIFVAYRIMLGILILVYAYI
tara:strand:+ start:918 stop:1709 length:792 start_codon:yes stop_codon:yes gene_type:complete